MSAGEIVENGAEEKRRDEPASDVLSGLFFLGVGIAGFLIAGNYPIGEINHMLSGYFPRLISVIIGIFGVVLTIRGALNYRRKSRHVAEEPLNVRALVCVPGSLAVFALIMEQAGLIISIVAAVFIMMFAEKTPRFRDYVVLSVVLCTASYVIFILGLGVRLPVFPELF